MFRTICVRVLVAVALVLTPFAAVAVAAGPAGGSGDTVQADPERCC